jgi:hypothetical protein
MRPPGISLFAIMSILVIGGCSASRNSLHPDRGDDQPYVPPRHDENYSPEIRGSEDEFESPVPPVPSREPVPAPPAMGISRIKSVGWLRLREPKASGKSSSGHTECGTSDEPLLGRCTPVESCAPQQDTVVVERVQRYREQVCGEGCVEHAGPLRSLGKSFRKMLHPGHASPCSETCADQTACAQAPVFGGKNFSPERPGTEEVSRGLHQKKKPRCLADSLDEPFSENLEPGLITPDDAILPSPEREVPRVPALQPVPTVPTIPMPKTFDEPVPGVPVPPAPFGPSTQVVEPPVWPRLGTNNYSYPVSRSAVSTAPTTSGSGVAFGVPQIIPGAHRRSEPTRELPSRR